MAFEKVADLSDLKPGQLTLVQVKGKAICLGNIGGRVFALANECTHRGGALSDGNLDGNEVECPLHGSRFDVLTGNATEGPAGRPVKVFEVSLTGDEVSVDID